MLQRGGGHRHFPLENGWSGELVLKFYSPEFEELYPSEQSFMLGLAIIDPFPNIRNGHI
jgi:hypothetical protein